MQVMHLLSHTYRRELRRKFSFDMAQIHSDIIWKLLSFPVSVHLAVVRPCSVRTSHLEGWENSPCKGVAAGWLLEP